MQSQYKRFLRRFDSALRSCCNGGREGAVIGTYRDAAEGVRVCDGLMGDLNFKGKGIGFLSPPLLTPHRDLHLFSLCQVFGRRGLVSRRGGDVFLRR